jgi:hypothetical protein
VIVDGQDVVIFPGSDLKKDKAVTAAWKESVRRVARAQALLWNASPISVRQAILAKLEQEDEMRQRS